VPRNWQKIEGGPDFKGLLQRRQAQIEDLAYWAQLQNVDCYGGTLGKRFGTQVVNGYGTTTVDGSTTTTIEVVDSSGFRVGSTVHVDGTLTFVSAVGGGYITVSPALTTAPLRDISVVQVLGGGSIETLFQAMYRDGVKKLYAAIAGGPHVIATGATPTVVGNIMPVTKVGTTGSALGSTQINLESGNGIVIGDWINFPTLSAEVFQVKTIYYYVIIIDRSLPFAVPAGTTVNLFPQRSEPTPLPEFVQYGNRTQMTGGIRAIGASPKVPLTPIVIEQRATYVVGTLQYRRHGVKPPYGYGPGDIPTNPEAAVAPSPVGTSPGALVPGAQYEYRFRYYNSVSGQESEGCLPAQITTDDINRAGHMWLGHSPDPQVDQIRLYRTSANGGGAWYRVLKFVAWKAGTYQVVTTLANPPQVPGFAGAVEVYDISADDELGAQMRDLMDFCIPDTVSVLGIWGQANRLIGIDQVTNTVVYSDQPDLQSGAFKGEAWPVNNQIFVSYDDGDVLTGIATFMDAVLIFKQHSVWRIVGIPPDIQIQAVHFRQDATAAGAMSHRSICVDHDEVIFRGTDAVYHLSRYEGQDEGFQSKRVSLPIDDLMQDHLQGSELQIIPHAVFYRLKRQFRLWITSVRCLVFQFDATVAGEGLGWSEWQLSPAAASLLGNDGVTVRCSCIARYDATVFRGNISNDMLVSPLDAGVFLGTASGAVLQMDIGQADYGGMAYPVFLRSLRFAPGGRGSGARIRALDWQVSALNVANPTIAFWSDILSPRNVTAEMPVDSGDTSTVIPPDAVDIISAEEVPYKMFSTLVIVPGQFHYFMWLEQNAYSMYRILGWTLWFQALPEATVRRQVLQTLPETVETEPEPPVIQG